MGHDAPFWQPALLTRRESSSASVFVSGVYGGEAESRRKVDDGDDDACASVYERVRQRARCASQRVREETGGKWDGGQARARECEAERRQGYSEGGCSVRASARTAQCMHLREVWVRRARVLVRACNWVAGSTTSAKAARAVVLDPLLFATAFDLISNAVAGRAGGNTAKAAILLLLRRIVFFIAIVCAVSFKVESCIM